MSTDSEIVAAWEREDPELSPQEKETTIRFAKDEDRATVFTAEAGLGRRVVAHPESTVEEVTVLADDSIRQRAPEEMVDGDEPVAVRCHLPVGALSVRASSRKNPQHAEVVSGRVLDEVEPVTDGGVSTPTVGDRATNREADDGEELIVLGLDGDAAEVVGVEEVESVVNGWRSVEDLRDAAAVGALAPRTIPTNRLAVSEVRP